MISGTDEKTESPYLAECPQLPPLLMRLVRRKQRLNPLQLLVLALHMRDCKAKIREAREAYLDAGGELPAEPEL